MTVERIVSLLSSATEMLFALDLGDRVVAVSHECDYPPEVRRLPRVTSTRIAATATSQEIDDAVRRSAAEGHALYEIDVQQLVALEPDLIVTQAQCDVCAVRYQDVLDAVRSRAELRQASVLPLNPRTLGDVLEDVQRVASAAGSPAAAHRVVGDLQRRIGRLHEAIHALATTDRPRVACIEWVEPLMLAGNWVPELVTLAGGQCSVPGDGQHSTYADWDALLDYDPQVIVVAPCGFDLARAAAEAPLLAARSGWQRISAVRSGRVFAADGNAYFNRSGPRLVDTAELLSHLLYPGLVGPPQALVEAVRWLDTA